LAIAVFDDENTSTGLGFAVNPRLRSYVLDEQGHLRENVVIFMRVAVKHLLQTLTERLLRWQFMKHSG
jgi:hypothetical protein